MNPGHQQVVLENALHALRGSAGVGVRLKGEAGVYVEAGGRHEFRPLVQTADRFGTPLQVKARAKGWERPPLLVAPYVSPEVAERCRAIRLAYIDTAGNAYMEGPGLYVCVTGRRRPAAVRSGRLRAVTRAGLQVTFAILSRPELLRGTQRELAECAGVALGSVGPVLKDLEARRMLLKTTDGWRLAEPKLLLEQWVAHYETTLRPRLVVRRFAADFERLAGLDVAAAGACWGGEPGADLLTQMLRPARYTIFVREGRAAIVAAARLRADDGGNVELIEPFWNFAPAAAQPAATAPAPLIYAELLASRDGRNLEIAERVYEQYIEPAFGSTPQGH